MAPKATGTETSAAGGVLTGNRVEKPKRRLSPVRRLENGLLDVNRKSARHVKA
jgi:hypothetical protein